MYKLYFFFLSICWVGTIQAQTYGAKFDGLQGEVKSILQKTYEKAGSEKYPEKGKLLNTTWYEFSREGYIIRQSRTGTDMADEETICGYNEKNTMERTIVYRNSHIVKQTQLIRETDWLKEWKIIEQDSIIEYRMLEWNSDTNVAWVTFLDGNRDIRSYGYIRYDKQGNMIKTFRHIDLEYRRKYPDTDFLNMYCMLQEFNEKNELLKVEHYNYRDGRHFDNAFEGTFGRIFPPRSKPDKMGNWTEHIGSGYIESNYITTREYTYYD